LHVGSQQGGLRGNHGLAFMDGIIVEDDHQRTGASTRQVPRMVDPPAAI
jgi:hypothetical protein